MIEILAPSIGAAFAKTILRAYLREQELPLAAGEELVDLLRKRSGDALAARRAARRLNDLEDQVASALAPMFEERYVQAASAEAIAAEVAKALEGAHFTLETIIAANNDFTRLKTQMVNANHKAADVLSQTEHDLYEVCLERLAHYVLDTAEEMPSFSRSNFSEVLRRLDILVTRSAEIMRSFQSLRNLAGADAASLEAWPQLEADYRATIMRRLDSLDLPGAGLPRTFRKYRMAVSYISLAARRARDAEDQLDDAERILSGVDRAVLIGGAGSGKTTLLKWLAVRAAMGALPRERTLPFYLELRRLGAKAPQLSDLVRYTAPEFESKFDSHTVHRRLNEGQALILIDGLDEVPPARHGRILDWIEELTDSYSSCRFVLSTRPAAGYEELADVGFESLHLVAMTPRQVSEFIQYWHRAVLVDRDIEPNDRATRFAANLTLQLRQNSALRRLTTNPLLCAMICALHYHRDMNLPVERLPLYAACIDMLLEGREVERGVDTSHFPQLTLDQKKLILQDLAYWMVRNGKTVLMRSAAANRVARQLRFMGVEAEPRNVLDFLVERAGLLREKTHGQLDFVHKTFQEYMAAIAVREEGDWGVLLRNSADALWHEIIVLAAGLANRQQADELVSSLLPKGRESGVREFLAFSCFEMARQISMPVREAVTNLLRRRIPPQTDEDADKLVAAGDLAVPFLGYSVEQTSEERRRALDILLRVNSASALSQAVRYVDELGSDVIGTVSSVLPSLDHAEVADSGLAEAVLRAVSAETANQLVLGSVLLESLSGDKSSWLSVFGELRPIVVLVGDGSFSRDGAACLEWCRRLIYLDLGLGGAEGLLGLSQLRVLTLVAGRGLARLLRDLENLPRLHHLKIVLPGEGDWPGLIDLSVLQRVRRLTLAAEYGFEMPELEQFVLPPRLRELRILLRKGDPPELVRLSPSTELRLVRIATDAIDSEIVMESIAYPAVFNRIVHLSPGGTEKLRLPASIPVMRDWASDRWAAHHLSRAAGKTRNEMVALGRAFGFAR